LSALKELDLVAVLRDNPDLGVRRGWVGTLLLQLAPDVWEVEFSDRNGRTIATAPLGTADLLALQMDQVR